MGEPRVFGVWPIEIREAQDRPGCYQVRIHGDAEYPGWTELYGEWPNALATNLYALSDRLKAAERENAELKAAVKTLVINSYEDVDDQHNDLVRGDDLLALYSLAMRKPAPSHKEDGDE